MPLYEAQWETLKLFSATPILPFYEIYSKLGVYPSRYNTYIHKDTAQKPGPVYVQYTYFPYNRAYVTCGATPEMWVSAHYYKQDLPAFNNFLGEQYGSTVTRESVKRRYEISMAEPEILRDFEDPDSIAQIIINDDGRFSVPPSESEEEA